MNDEMNMNKEISINKIALDLLACKTESDIKGHLDEYYVHLKPICKILESLETKGVLFGLTTCEDTGELMIGIKFDCNDEIHRLDDVLNRDIDIMDGLKDGKKTILFGTIEKEAKAITDAFSKEGYSLGLANFIEDEMSAMVMIDNSPLPLIFLVAAICSIGYLPIKRRNKLQILN